MENQNSKILSFEEFLNKGSEMPADMDTQEVPELPAHDGDPAGDAPVASDMELVDGPAATVEPAEGDEATAEMPAEMPAEVEKTEEPTEGK
jgi:hypothetical protein